MGPIDYTSAFANLPGLGDSIMKGMQGGLALNQMQADQQKQQAALAQQQRQQQVISQLVANPSAGGEEYANAMLQVPGMSEQLKQSWEMKSAEAQKQQLSDLSQWGAAIQNKQPQIVVDGLNARADAIENSAQGTTPESKALRAKAQAVKENPDFGRVLINSMLSVHPQGKAVIDNIAALGQEQRAADLAPAAVRKGVADADDAEASLDQKNTSIVGSTLGSLIGKNAKPTQVKTAIGSLFARKRISADRRAELDAGIPDDPKLIDAYLASVRDAGIKPDDQKKFTTPTADAQLQAQTSRYSTDSAARTAANRLAFDQDQAKDSPAAPVGTPGLQGQQYLSSLDKPTADQVRALAEGRLGFPVGKALQSPYWQKMITAVAQYDPSFDAINYNARAKARGDFTAGKTGSNIKAINTAIAHMGQLNEQMTALNNTRSEAFNTVANWTISNFGGQGLQTKMAGVEATSEGVAGEMAKVFRDTGMSAEEIKTWREKFKTSTTPAAQKGTMQAGMHMLQGRMEAIEDQYHEAMGTTAQPLKILTPEAQKVFDKILGKKPGPKPAPTPTAPPAPRGPTVGAVESGADGKRYRFKGGDPGQALSWEVAR